MYEKNTPFMKRLSFTTEEVSSRESLLGGRPGITAEALSWFGLTAEQLCWWCKALILAVGCHIMQSGETWKEGLCRECECRDSEVVCFQLSCPPCPPGSMAVREKGDCCPRCQPGMDPMSVVVIHHSHYSFIPFVTPFGWEHMHCTLIWHRAHLGIPAVPSLPHAGLTHAVNFNSSSICSCKEAGFCNSVYWRGIGLRPKDGSQSYWLLLL